MKTNCSGTLLKLAIFTVIFTVSLSPSVRAENHESDILKRMMERLSELIELKIQGTLEEGSDGYLHIAPNKQTGGDLKRLMSKENIDRKEIYRIIGLKSIPMMDASAVGKMRAQLRKS